MDRLSNNDIVCSPYSLNTGLVLWQIEIDKRKYRMFDRVAVLYILCLIEQGTQRKRQAKLSNYGHDLKGFSTFGISDFVRLKK